MSTWIVCVVLGLITVVFVPSLLAGMVKVLSSVGRKYPVMSDIVATLTLFLMSIVLLAQIIVFTIVYHHLFVGTP